MQISDDRCRKRVSMAILDGDGNMRNVLREDDYDEIST